MPRTTPSEKIQTRAARSRLPQRRKPHWLCLRPGALHLGYVRRNIDAAGHWTVRRYNGGGTYKVARLPGIADDIEAANGATVLSFIQAQDLALRPTPQAQTAAPMLVAQAMVDYVDYLQTSGREGAAITAERGGRLHVLPQLGEVQVQALTTEQLRHWLAALANRLAKRNGHEDPKAQPCDRQPYPRHAACRVEPCLCRVPRAERQRMAWPAQTIPQRGGGAQALFEHPRGAAVAQCSGGRLPRLGASRITDRRALQRAHTA